MKNFDYRRFVIPTKLSNTDNRQRFGDSHYDTVDYVFLDSREDHTSLALSRMPRKTYETYYSVMNGSGSICSTVDMDGKKNMASYVRLRSAADIHRIDSFSGLDGKLFDRLPDEDFVTFTPAMHLDINAVIQARKESDENFRIYPVARDDGEKYHVIEIGEGPSNNYVGDKMSNHFEELLKSTGNENLVPTGVKHLGYIDKNGNPCWYEEYEYCGQKYVRTKMNRRLESCGYNFNSTHPQKLRWVWMKVEPMRWIIRNWDDLPSQINPKGKDRAGYIDVRTEEGILSLPFGSGYWQESPIRAYLNGYSPEQMIGAGNYRMLFFNKEKLPDFTEHNFLTSTFTRDNSNVHTSSQTAKEIVKHLGAKKTIKGLAGKVSDYWLDVMIGALCDERERRLSERSHSYMESDSENSM